MNHISKPKVRNVIQFVTHQDKPLFVIQDVLQLAENGAILPHTWGLLATLCDGQNSISELQAAMEKHYRVNATEADIENVLEQFDQALLLNSENFNRTKQQTIDEYRLLPFRRPSLAGHSYPAKAEELRLMLKGYLDNVNGVHISPSTSRAIISPHIDYQRGGMTYAQVWASAAEAVREAELIIILGTDHNGGYGTLTLTRQNYASPLGVMPTDTKLVDRLAEALGTEAIFADELHHREEHSIELALVWLQYLRREEPCFILPVLCGTFHHFVTGQASIEDEPMLNIFVDILRDEMVQRRVVLVAAGDLAHLGPAFDGPPLDSVAHAQMKTDDEQLMNNLAKGDAAAFFQFMQNGQHNRNVCGLSPFYLTLELLEKSAGRVISYDRCPADGNNSSFVSVCGMVLD